MTICRYRSAIAWFCITLFYCYQYIIRVLPNIAMNDLISKFGITAGEFGTFAGVYYIGYVLIHIPVGILLNRYMARMILPIFILLTAFGVMCITYANSWYFAVFGRFLTGVGSAAAAIGIIQMFKTLYPRKFSIAMGLSVSLGLITLVYAGGVIAVFVPSMGIVKVFSILSILGVALAFFSYVFMPKNVVDATGSSEILDGLKSVIFNKDVILLSLVAGLMVGPLEGFADAWGGAFLSKLYSIDVTVANKYTLNLFLGMCVGCIIVPLISDRNVSCYTTIMSCAVGMLICFVLLLDKTFGVGFVGILCTLIGFFSAYQVIIIPQVTNFVAASKSGLVGAVANMILMAFGSIFHSSIGCIFQYFTRGDIKSNILDYGEDVFLFAISFVPICVFIAILILFYIIVKGFVRKRKARY